MRIFATTLAIIGSLTGSTAFPTGAGSCFPGKSAVAGSHLMATSVETGSLEDQNMELLINGVPLISSADSSGGISMDIPIGMDHIWELRMATNSTPGFRGYLLRLDDGGSADGFDISDSLTPIPGQGGQTQIAAACIDGAGSATHRSRALKSSVMGQLRLDELSSSTLNLDVTVVMQNTGGLSKHSYSHFLLTAVEGPEEVVVEEEAPEEVVVEEEKPEGEVVEVETPEEEVAEEVVEETPEEVVVEGTPEEEVAETPEEEVVEEEIVEEAPEEVVAEDEVVEEAPEEVVADEEAPVEEEAAEQEVAEETVDPTLNPTANPTPNPTQTLSDGDDDDDDDDDDDEDPTQQLTLAPSSAIVLPRLTMVQPSCNENNTCTVCQGDCDMDMDCEGDLACFQRDTNDDIEVPGCAGKGSTGRDYCYDPVEYPDALRLWDEDCSEDDRCFKCEGDCDVDSDCEGTLECFQRRGGSNETVPGCYGVGFPSRDYCFDRNDMDVIDMEPGMTQEEEVEAEIANFEEEEEESDQGATQGSGFIEAPTKAPTEAPIEETEAPTEQEEEEIFEGEVDVAIGADEKELTEGSCSSMNPCGECVGDCDFDNQCGGEGLECYPRRVGSVVPVPGCNGDGYAGWDYCYKPPLDLLRPRVTPCTPDSPCLKCQADCDSNDDCQGNLVCFFRQGFAEDTIPGCTGTPQGNLDYCYDPTDDRRALRGRNY